MYRKIEKNISTKILNAIVNPVEKFLSVESSSGILLIITTLIALIWANSPFYHSYEHLIHYPLGFIFGDVSIKLSLIHWINDGLMVIFFYVVGLEIKRELIFGELSTIKKATLPMFAALGGMIIPALIYYLINTSGISARGWGISMATDIAFAVGILSLLGKRVPFSLKIFLLALAIVDDLGAVMVIAIFYTETLNLTAIIAATICFALIYFFQKSAVRNPIVYILLGITSWIAVLNSGIHATVSGVILGFLTSSKPWYLKDVAKEKLKNFLQRIRDVFDKDNTSIYQLDEKAKHHFNDVKNLANGSISAIDRLIHSLHPWVSFLIMPIFAFVNAGVRVRGVDVTDIFSNSIFLGVSLGLFIGKPIGIFSACFVAVKFKLAQLPKGVNWTYILGTGMLGGVGFTMALFISGLALKIAPELEMFSKTGILMASLFSGIAGAITLLIASKKNKNYGSQ